MRNFVKLNMVDGTTIVEGTGEDDSPDHIITENTKPVMIDATQIMKFHTRKGERIGTRIVLRNGSAVPVKDTFEEVQAAVEAALA